MDWREAGWDRSFLEEQVSNIEEGVHEHYPEVSLPILRSYAAEMGRDGVAAVLSAMLAIRTGYVADVLFHMKEAPLTVSLEMGRVLWTYAFRNGDDDGMRALERARVPFPRALLNDQSQNDVGDRQFIYLMLEEGSKPAICKIGRTARDPTDRERQLNASTSQHRRITLVEYWEVADSAAAERQLFAALADRRVNDRREFFEISPHEARRIIERVLSN